jgi:signal transduction histidine kinase
LRALPIRLRLALAFAVAMAFVLAAVGLFLYDRLDSSLVGAVDASLRGQVAESLPRLGRERELIDSDARAGSTIAQLTTNTGRILRSTPPGLVRMLDRRHVRDVLAGRPLLESVHLPGFSHPWRVLAVPVPGRGEVFVVARSLEARQETLRRLLREFLIVGPLGLLLASVAGYGLAAAALRPVEAMRRRAGSVSAKTPGQRLPVPRAKDEIARLATTLNDMLERLEAAFAHERRFVADASHELRTPLTLLRTELDLALRRRRTREELEQALRDAAEDVERLTRLADDLLLLAAADSNGLPIRPALLDVQEVLERSRARFAARAHELGRTLEVEDGGVQVVVGDPDRLDQALANLVENGFRHGGGNVRLSARQEGNAVELHVEDDGPGFPPGFLTDAFAPFRRADEARSGSGTGLGLAIVELIASAHGGSAGAANRPAGGADVWISLPLSPTQIRARRGAAMVSSSV